MYFIHFQAFLCILAYSTLSWLFPQHHGLQLHTRQVMNRIKGTGGVVCFDYYGYPMRRRSMCHLYLQWILQDYLYEDIGADSTEVLSIINNNGAENNFLQLQIYFEELNYEQITETQAYTVNICSKIVIIVTICSLSDNRGSKLRQKLLNLKLQHW